MNFGVAKFFGAIDKRFQDKYNYLIDLLSKSVPEIKESSTFVPVVSSTGGAYVDASATSFYVKTGKTVTLFYKITVTDKGTATGETVITLPVTAAAYSCKGIGVEINTTGVSMYNYVASDGKLHMSKYDGTSLIQDGYVFEGSITYISAT